MYFENYKVELTHWDHWRNWSEDITERNAFLGLDFVREFASVYKKQTDALEDEYQKTKQGLVDTHNSEMDKIRQDHQTRCGALESEKNTVMSTLNSENQRVTTIMNDIKSLETVNAAAVSISDYVQLKEQREADLAEFNRLQEERKKIAISLFEEKKRIENEKYENACTEKNRQHEEKLQVLNNDHKVAVERLEKEYRELFTLTLMSTDCYNAYKSRCNGFNYSLEKYTCRKTTPEYVYMGVLQMFIPKELKTSLVKELIEELFGDQKGGIDDPYEIRLPYCQKIVDGVGLFIKDVGSKDLSLALKEEHKKKTFEDELPMRLLRTFMAFPAGQVEAFTIDTGKIGAVFHDLLVLGSRHKRIIEPASSKPDDIERKLSTLRSKIDGIANNYGTAFDARMKREPYYALAISNFPEGFTSKALKDLSTIVKNASACGVAVYILATETRLNNLSGEDKIIVDEIMQTLHCTTGNENTLKCEDKYVKGDVNVLVDGIYDYEKPVLDTVIGTLLDGINGYKAVTTTFEDIYPNIQDMNTWLSRDTVNGINIPVGIKGSSDIVNISLGASGASNEHHVLIEGSTGVGKTTFLHTLIMSTLLSYSQNEVEIYLVDFKAGVEFKIYADHAIPSLKIVSIQSEREFGFQVFKAIEEEFARRTAEFRSTGATSTGNYRELTNKTMPKIMLVIDEYQELFSINDEITHECERILRTLVLEGRALGIHIILATQNTRQARLDNEIYQQMVVRIALKGSENVLSADNDGTQLLVNSSAGTTIYNNNRGETTSNKVFQTAYLGNSDYQNELLEKISSLQRSMQAEFADESKVPNKILYTNIEDNRQHKLNKFIIDGAVPEALDAGNDKVYGLFLGETYELKGNLSIGLLNQPNSNLFISISPSQLPKIMMNSLISLLYGDLACRNATRGNRLVHFINMSGDELGNEVKKLESFFPECIKYAAPDSSDNDWAIVTSGYENVKEIIDNTYDELCKRRSGTYNPDDRIIFVLAGMDKVDALVNLNSYEKQSIDEYAIDDSGKATEKNALEKLIEIIKFGPEYSINSIMATNDIEATSRMYGERFYDDFALRIGQQLSENNMIEIVREYHSSTLKPNTLVFFKKGSQANKKFRAYEIPGDEWLKNYANRYHSFTGCNQ